MATIVPPRNTQNADERPLLYDGQQLSQEEFHRLYETCPTDQKFELIDGVVYMAAAQYRPHSLYEPLLSWLLMNYRIETPGIEILHNATTILNERNEPQPDLQVRIRAEFGGQTIVTPKQAIAGPPELVIEVSHSTVDLDLNKKLTVYQKLGVKEYWVVCVDAAVIRWFAWPGDERLVDADGILRSVTFPGLWINCVALFKEQFDELKMTLNAGLNHPKHAEFVITLQRNAQ